MELVPAIIYIDMQRPPPPAFAVAGEQDEEASPVRNAREGIANTPTEQNLAPGGFSINSTSSARC